MKENMFRMSAAWSAFWKLIVPTAAEDAPPRDYPFVASDVAQLQRLRPAAGGAALDAATWADLLLDDYAARLSAGVSIFGQQVLHQRLRAGMAPDDRDALGDRLDTLLSDTARLGALERDMRVLRNADSETAALLFEEAIDPAPWWAGRTWLLPPALAGACAAATTVTPLAWLAAFGLLYLLLAGQMGHAERIEAWKRKLDALQLLLRTSSVLGARGGPLLRDFGADRAAAGVLNRALTRSPVTAMVPGLRTYLDWFMLDNVNHYYRTRTLVATRRELLRACYLRCANLEADIALARHLLATPRHCRAQFGAVGVLAMELAVHPLLARAQPLSLALEGKGAFVSGQNGIGKSTLLRAVGLNLVTARAFGFCYAQAARVPDLPVYTSMQSEDALLGGESLYMAELRRARELLAAADGPHPGICLIDEIFRGTNHIESVAAAAAVLDALAGKGMIFVSSHNLVLASLLAHRLAPWCVALDEGGALALRPGVLAHTNGIALLAERDFGGAVQANAGKVFDWLSGYLAHPADGARILA